MNTLSGMHTIPTVKVCTDNLQIPRTAMYCYVVNNLDAAMALHASKRREMPGIVYQLRREFYFPVAEVKQR